MFYIEKKVKQNNPKINRIYPQFETKFKVLFKDFEPPTSKLEDLKKYCLENWGEGYYYLFSFGGQPPMNIWFKGWIE